MSLFFRPDNYLLPRPCYAEARINPDGPLEYSPLQIVASALGSRKEAPSWLTVYRLVLLQGLDGLRLQVSIRLRKAESNSLSKGKSSGRCSRAQRRDSTAGRREVATGGKKGKRYVRQE